MSMNGRYPEECYFVLDRQWLPAVPVAVIRDVAESFLSAIALLKCEISYVRPRVNLHYAGPFPGLT